MKDQKDVPDFWVLCHMKAGDDDRFSERFFVLSHQEMWDAQAARNAMYADGYFARHGNRPDMAGGVDNVKVTDLVQFEDGWGKIVRKFGER